nr:enoyl-CoA hydratase-related protein [Ruegeria atlantica]
MSDLVKYELCDRVATLTLNRPEEGNAWSEDMEQALRNLVLKADQGPNVRSIVITGAGRAFCVGRSMQGLSFGAGKETGTREDIEAHRDRFSYLTTLRKPVIAAINGGMAGVGFVLSLYCDLRFMSDKANFATSFARRGLVAEEGSAWLLPRLIGQMNAMDILLSGRKVSAVEAGNMGLVRVVPAGDFAETVQSFAADLANASSPRSMGIIKQQVWSAHKKTLSEVTRASSALVQASVVHQDFAEGVAHFKERRMPQFADLED